MRVLEVDPAAPSEDALVEAVQLLAHGGVLALPTETFYGLAADALAPAALRRVKRLKGKSMNSPMLLLLADRSQVEQVIVDPPPLFQQLADRFWPGPLTLVAAASPALPREVTGDLKTVAVRVPGMALPRRLAARLGRPISGVSANRTTLPPCRTAGAVAAAFPEGLALILDGGPTPGEAPSTIVEVGPDGAHRIVRQGLLALSALEPYLGGGTL
jgi:L-threonylcarbamoyladenylate synthase